MLFKAQFLNLLQAFAWHPNHLPYLQIGLPPSGNSRKRGSGHVSVISRYMFCWTPAKGRQVTQHRLSNLDRCHHSRMDKGNYRQKTATWDSHLPLLFQPSCFPEKFRELHLGWDDGQKVKETSSSFTNMWLTTFLPLAFRIIYILLQMYT